MNDEQNNNNDNENLNETENDEVVDNDKADDDDSANNEEVKDWKAEAEKWRSNSRKNETTSKENYKKLNDLTSEYETLKGQLAEANKFKDENFNLMKRLVIAETGLPSELSGRLNGSTEEELKKDAEGLMELFGQFKKTPKPVKAQGSDEDSEFNSGTIRTAEDYEKSYRNQR